MHVAILQHTAAHSFAFLKSEEEGNIVEFECQRQRDGPIATQGLYSELSNGLPCVVGDRVSNKIVGNSSTIEWGWWIIIKTPFFKINEKKLSN